MLKQIKLTNVGPAPSMELKLGERLNILTGDNGLGKSFLLDIVWWALTRRWPAEVNPKLTGGLMARPNGSDKATIELELDSKVKKVKYISTFERMDQVWKGKQGRPWMPGLVLYALVDGSFAVWDPARNYWREQGDLDAQKNPPAFVFSPGEVWNGLEGEGTKQYCEGLIRDWSNWQKQSAGGPFKHLKNVLKKMSPSGEQLEPGELTRIDINDVRDMPTLKMPYGQSVPVVHASAGMRRIIALAYLLVWAWEEHKRASKLLGQETTSQIIFLIDEIEAHLHPKWQRKIVGALMNVVKSLAPKVQIVAATHSPLIMASVEPIFDAKKDAWFDLDLNESRVELTKRDFERRGDATNWLTSEAFNLKSARSEEAEKVLIDAMNVIKEADKETINAQSRQRFNEMDTELRKVLSETDTFWIRWRFIGEKKGWL